MPVRWPATSSHIRESSGKACSSTSGRPSAGPWRRRARGEALMSVSIARTPRGCQGTMGHVSAQLRAPRVPIPPKIWVLVGAAFVIAIGFGLVSPVLPAYARSFDVGVTGASIIVSAFAFFRLAFAPVGGRLVSALGERPVYLVGLLIVAASSFATAFAGS